MEESLQVRKVIPKSECPGRAKYLSLLFYLYGRKSAYMNSAELSQRNVVLRKILLKTTIAVLYIEKINNIGITYTYNTFV